MKFFQQSAEIYGDNGFWDGGYYARFFLPLFERFEVLLSAAAAKDQNKRKKKLLLAKIFASFY